MESNIVDSSIYIKPKKPGNDSRTGLNSRWAIVLAGGEGERMRPLTKRLFGEHIPKQYCAFTGSRSMLQQSLDRIAPLVAPEHIVTVIGRGHRVYLDRALTSNLPGRLIEQPLNRGTAAGIFVTLSHVYVEDPLATVMILPTDMYIDPEYRFQNYAEMAFLLADKFQDRLVILGARPDKPETDYGWFETAESIPFPFKAASPCEPLAITKFHEKPRGDKAGQLFRAGGVWNTMVLAAKAKALWGIGQQCLPMIMNRFESYRCVLQAVHDGKVDVNHEQIALTHTYQWMEEANFSSEILKNIASRIMVLTMEGVEWSDWGRPERVQQTRLWDEIATNEGG